MAEEKEINVAKEQQADASPYLYDEVKPKGGLRGLKSDIKTVEEGEPKMQKVVTYDPRSFLESEDELRDFEQNYGKRGYEIVPAGEAPREGDIMIDHQEDGRPYNYSRITRIDKNGNRYGVWREGGVVMPEQDLYGDDKAVYYRRIPDERDMMRADTLRFLDSVKRR